MSPLFSKKQINSLGGFSNFLTATFCFILDSESRKYVLTVRMCVILLFYYYEATKEWIMYVLVVQTMCLADWFGFVLWGWQDSIGLCSVVVY
jgi:hypothetical protein